MHWILKDHLIYARSINRFLAESSRRRKSIGIGGMLIVAMLVFSYKVSAQTGVGEPPRPSYEIRPMFSPDGQKIAFNSNRSGNIDIYVLSLESGVIEQLTRHRASDLTPRWSPDGKQILFYSNRIGNSWASTPGFELFVVNVDGKEFHRITSSDGNEMFPDWSPDGEKIVCTFDNGKTSDLVVVDTNGSEQIRLTEEWPGGIGEAQWSQNTGEIVASAAIRGAEAKWPEGAMEIVVFDKTLTEVRRLTTNQINEYGPSWSPDGQQIVFQVSPKGENDQIYVMTKDGANRRQLTREGNNNTATWSPNGRQIAFVSDRKGGNFDLYIMQSDGSDQRRLLRW